MKKEMTVVFPFYRDGDKNLILTGKQAPGKKLAGYRNGYGGKCEQDELPVDCATREVKEEIGIDLDKEKLIYVGYIIDGDKKVYFYLYELQKKIELPDNDEFVDNRWFEVEKIDEYIGEMLPGNRELMENVNDGFSDLKNIKTFELDFSGNPDLQNAVKNIYK